LNGVERFEYILAPFRLENIIKRYESGFDFLPVLRMFFDEEYNMLVIHIRLGFG
jgi:hypothetical protein